VRRYVIDRRSLQVAIASTCPRLTVPSLTTFKFATLKVEAFLYFLQQKILQPFCQDRITDDDVRQTTRYDNSQTLQRSAKNSRNNLPHPIKFPELPIFAFKTTFWH